jgi:hypothetical protein
LFNT